MKINYFFPTFKEVVLLPLGANRGSRVQIPLELSPCKPLLRQQWTPPQFVWDPPTTMLGLDVERVLMECLLEDQPVIEQHILNRDRIMAKFSLGLAEQGLAQISQSSLPNQYGFVYG